MTTKQLTTESNENSIIKLADEARDFFNKREFKECINCLDKLNNPKSTQVNKLIAKYLIDKDAKTFLENSDKHSQEYSNDLSFNQQTIIDYNKALILSKQLDKFNESIDLLERRVKLIETTEQIDHSILTKVYVLLVTIYMEKKFRIKRALELLDCLNDKLKGENLPKNFYYLKVRCYLAKTDFINFRKFMDKLTNNEQFMVRCYLESFGGIEQSISKLSTFNSLNNVNLKNNEALTKFPNDKVAALYDLTKIFNSLTPEVLYNLGIMHLNTGNIENALLIFRILLKDFRKNPRLWSRIADCHLIKFKSSQPNPFKCNLESVTRFVGENQQRKLILKPVILKINCEEELKKARSCLLNSLILLKHDGSSFYPSNELMASELKKFKASILTKLVYVNLCLSDFVSANFYSDLNLKDFELIQQSSNNLLYIETILYKCESLIWLDKSEEAENLLKRLLTNNKLDRDAVGEEYDGYINQCKRLNYIDWDERLLKYIVLHNLAACSAMRHNLQDLQKYLIDANIEIKNIQENSTNLILLSIYKYVISKSC